MEETFIIPENPGGLLEVMDPRNHKYGAIFGEEASIPRKFILDVSDVKVPYQGPVPCCVPCSFSFINQWYSLKNDKNQLELSFRKVHADTGEYNKGRSLYQIAEYEKTKGQPQSKYCPNDVNLPAAQFMKADLTPEGIEDAGHRKIGPYSFIDTINRNELMSAIMNGPIMATGGGNNTDWGKGVIKLVNAIAWYHDWVIIGWDLDLYGGVWIIKNWWNDGTRYLDINYPLTGALSFRDMPDGEENNMLRTVRVAGKVDTYAISGNTKMRIPDSDSFHYYTGQCPVLNPNVEEISQAELDKYALGETMPSVKFMRALQPICADVFLNETDSK